MTESRQRSASNFSSNPDRTARRGPPPPLSTTRSALGGLVSPLNSLLTPLNGPGSQYSLLSPGGAARSTSPRGRAHTVADPHLIQRQQSYLQNSTMYNLPPPPPQPASTPASHMALPPPPPRPTASNNHGGIPIPGPPPANYWAPPPRQYQQHPQQNYNPSLYQHTSYNILPPPPVRGPQQQQEALTSATYVPGGESFGPGMLLLFANLHITCTDQGLCRRRNTSSAPVEAVRRTHLLRQQLSRQHR
jgi:hypothetical protein